MPGIRASFRTFCGGHPALIATSVRTVHPFMSPLITASLSALRSMAAPFAESVAASLSRVGRRLSPISRGEASPNRQMTARPDVRGSEACGGEAKDRVATQVGRNYAKLHNAILHNRGRSVLASGEDSSDTVFKFGRIRLFRRANLFPASLERNGLAGTAHAGAAEAAVAPGVLGEVL